MERTRVWPQLALFALLAVGAAVVWGAAVIFVIETFVRPTVVPPFAYERLAIDAEGEPLVYHYRIVGGGQELQYRTLDGEPSPPPEITFPPVQLESPERRPRLWAEGPLRWEMRLLSASEGRRPAVTWYIVRDGSETGYAFLAGYDEQTRLNVGYIGREGFSSHVPPVSEQIVLGSTRYSMLNGRIAGHTLGWHGPQEASGRHAVPQWCVYFAGDDRVIEVDLRARRVRTIVEAPQVVSVGIATQVAAVFGEGGADHGRMTLGDERLLVRLEDRVAAIDPSTNERTDFLLPTIVRDDGDLNFYLLSDSAALIDQAAERTGATRRLIWTNREGEISREVLVELAQPHSSSERFELFTGVAAVPLPLVIGPFFLSVVPGLQVVDGRAPNYLEARAELLRIFWPAGLSLLVVSAAAAWAVIRQQRRYGRRRTALWSILTFLFGVPGLVSYLLQHRRAPLVDCPACSNRTPRNRPACTRCGQDFPRPRLIGTEVFA